jgi:hypothetical protein
MSLTHSDWKSFCSNGLHAKKGAERSAGAPCDGHDGTSASQPKRSLTTAAFAHRKPLSTQRSSSIIRKMCVLSAKLGRGTRDSQDCSQRCSSFETCKQSCSLSAATHSSRKARICGAHKFDRSARSNQELCSWRRSELRSLLIPKISACSASRCKPCCTEVPDGQLSSRLRKRAMRLPTQPASQQLRAQTELDATGSHLASSSSSSSAARCVIAS